MKANKPISMSFRKAKQKKNGSEEGHVRGKVVVKTIHSVFGI